jgi:methylated-DNA-[protein]-cysteine S-methyltransferase
VSGATIGPKSCLEVLVRTPLRFHVTDTDLGWVTVVLSDKGLKAISLPMTSQARALDEAARLGGEDPAAPQEASLLDTAMRALVAGQPLEGQPALDWDGITSFRRQVLEKCAQIPAGETRSYKWLAEQVGRPRSARAVGRVMATNPWPLLVPCHRVLGSNGKLHGYGGGLPMKDALLRAEGVVSR